MNRMVMGYALWCTGTTTHLMTSNAMQNSHMCAKYICDYSNLTYHKHTRTHRQWMMVLHNTSAKDAKAELMCGCIFWLKPAVVHTAERNVSRRCLKKSFQ